MYFDAGNRFFAFIFIISMIMSLMCNFGVGIWDVFIVYKFVYKIIDICFKFSTIE